MFRRRPILFPRRPWRRRVLRPGCFVWLLPILAMALIVSGWFQPIYAGDMRQN